MYTCLTPTGRLNMSTVLRKPADATVHHQVLVCLCVSTEWSESCVCELVLCQAHALGVRVCDMSLLSTCRAEPCARLETLCEYVSLSVCALVLD
jgi:hypothetical protein